MERTWFGRLEVCGHGVRTNRIVAVEGEIEYAKKSHASRR